MADAAFEAVLGTVLLLGAAFGQVDGDDFASPASTGVLAIFGGFLMVLAVALAQLVKGGLITDAVLIALAAGNAAFAVLIAVWVSVADGFSGTGRAVIWVTVAALALLAATQAALVARR